MSWLMTVICRNIVHSVLMSLIVSRQVSYTGRRFARANHSLFHTPIHIPASDTIFLPNAATFALAPETDLAGFHPAGGACRKFETSRPGPRVARPARVQIEVNSK